MRKQKRETVTVHEINNIPQIIFGCKKYAKNPLLKIDCFLHQITDLILRTSI
jgi:hypothetical protein